MQKVVLWEGKIIMRKLLSGLLAWGVFENISWQIMFFPCKWSMICTFQSIDSHYPLFIFFESIFSFSCQFWILNFKFSFSNFNQLIWQLSFFVFRILQVVHFLCDATYTQGKGTGKLYYMPLYLFMCLMCKLLHHCLVCWFRSNNKDDDNNKLVAEWFNKYTGSDVLALLSWVDMTRTASATLPSQANMLNINSW